MNDRQGKKPPKERIELAAVRYPDGALFTGRRHSSCMAKSGRLDADRFYDWILHAVGTLLRNRAGGDREAHDPDLWHFRRGLRPVRAVHPEGDTTWVKGWPQFREGGVRLVAAFEGFTLLLLRGLAIQPIATPGFVGVIDLEAGTPDVSRRRVIRGDVDDVLHRARLAVREQVVDNLNALESEGLVIEKLEFIARCVRLYGRQVILDSSLRWISFLKLPGEVELISCAALLDRISSARSLFVAFGTGPWTAMKRWVALGSQPMEPEPAIVVDDSPGDRLGYHSGSDEKIGTLVALWPNCAQADLFGTILRVAAEAWQISLEDLCDQDGWRHAGSALWGRLTRP